MLQPTYWVIENPRGRLRRLDLLAGIPRRTVWYCRLGLDRAKPTDLWGVFPPGLELPPGCHNGNPDHIAAPRGSRTGTQGGVSTEEAGRIPRQLAERFRVALEQPPQDQAAAAESRRFGCCDRCHGALRCRADAEP